jgi:hypothetical protein
LLAVQNVWLWMTSTLLVLLLLPVIFGEFDPL